LIDLHCHIIPGIDDGPKLLEESLEMCRIAVSDGISKVVCTPHNTTGKYSNGREKIIRHVNELQAAINENGIPLILFPGCEIQLEPGLVARIREGELMTVNDSGKYVILELPGEALPHNMEEIISFFVFAGLVPIISHPERNPALIRNPEIIYRMVTLGALTQLTTSSLNGRFGSEIEAFSVSLLEHDLVHMMVTDAHSSTRRRPVFSEALNRLKRIVGEEAAMEMVREVPGRILNGEDIDTRFPVPWKKESVRKRRSFMPGIFRKRSISS